jgi:glucokinase
MNTFRLSGALDIGGTKILVGLIDQHGELLARRRIETPAPRRAEEAIARVGTTLRALLCEIGVEEASLGAIGCSVPGPLDSKSGTIIFSPNLGWRDVPFVELLRRQFAVPIAIEDDADCAALAEAHLGAARGARSAVYVTISTGIGSGIVIEGRLYGGAHGCAGEVGHITLDSNGPVCSCGNSGCFEALASGSAIAARAKEAVTSGQKTLLARFHDDPALLTASEVMQAATAGDAVAKQIIEAAGEYIGLGLAAVACAFDPEIIVVGGGVVQANDLLLTCARATFAARAIPPLGSLVSIVPAALGDESALRGAALLVTERLEEGSHV